MQFLLLLVLSFICLVPRWPAPPDGITREESVALSALAVGFVVFLASFTAQYVRQVVRHDPGRREQMLSRYATLRFYHLLLLIGTSFLVLYVCGWGNFVEWLCTIDPEGQPWILPGAELLLLVPFFAGLLLSWACFYDAERALHDAAVPLFTRPFWSRAKYVAFHTRQNLALIAAPLVLLITMLGIERMFAGVRDHDLFAVGSFGLMIVTFACMPWVLRLVLGLSPLPPGALRDRLEAAARRLRFRYSDILLWNTYGGVANAMVVGVLPVPRYVVLSDRLVTGMTNDELEAVFGHEVGHVKHHHMLYYLGFLFTSLLVLMLAGQIAAEWAAERWPGFRALLRDNQDWMMLPFLSSLVLYIFVVFGFLSRRCERQADIFGCRTVSCDRSDCPSHGADARLQPEGRGLCPTGIRTFIQALDKVAYLNGMSRSKPGWLQSWQHSTIARRVEFLQQMLADPHLEPRFQRRVGRVKWALVVVLAGLLGALLSVGSHVDAKNGADRPPMTSEE